jgi:hypothetical protein
MIKNSPELSELYLDYIAKKIPCIHEDLWKKIVFFTYNLEELSGKVSHIVIVRKNFIGYCKDLNQYNKIWWEARGWPLKDIEYQIWKYKKENKRNSISAFSREFWLNRGYTIEQADFERNSIRPICKEYWIKKGFNEQEAIEKAKEFKDSNNKNGSKGRRNLNPWEKSTRIEYYLERGYSLEDAKNVLKERQATFSLEKCIEKYGEDAGSIVWRERQDKWQNTLNSKPLKEICRINKSKGRTFEDHVLKYGEERAKERLYTAGFNYRKHANCSGILYYIKFYNDEIEFWKIGITKQKIDERFWNSNIKRHNLNYEVIDTKEDIYSNCFMMEQVILKEYKENRIKIDYQGFNSVECFNKNIFDIIPTNLLETNIS